MSTSDPEEIRARVVVLGAPHADVGDEWARPELEAFHLPSPAHQPPGFLADHQATQPEAEQPPLPVPAGRSSDTSTSATASASAAAPAPPSQPPPPPAPLETEQPPNARPASSSSATTGANDNKKHTPPAALRDLFRFADGLDCVLMLVGTLGALVHGCSLPVFLRFFADLVDSFGSHSDDPDTMVRLVVKYAFYFLVVGAAIWASSWAGALRYPANFSSRCCCCCCCLRRELPVNLDDESHQSIKQSIIQSPWH